MVNWHFMKHLLPQCSPHYTMLWMITSVYQRVDGCYNDHQLNDYSMWMDEGKRDDCFTLDDSLWDPMMEEFDCSLSDIQSMQISNPNGCRTFSANQESNFENTMHGDLYFVTILMNNV